MTPNPSLERTATGYAAWPFHSQQINCPLQGQATPPAPARSARTLDRMTTKRWLIALEGDSTDLEEFPYWFPSGGVYAVAEGRSVFLTGPSFLPLCKPEDVRDLAAQVLDEFSAVISLLWPSLQAPRLGTVFSEAEDGSRHGTQFGMVGTAISRTKLRGTFSGTSGPTQAQGLLAASRGASHLSTALLLWADPVRTWPRLYRLLEELKEHLGQPVSKAGLCSANELARFTQSANSADIAGKDARHASGMFEPPSRPMNLEQATSFARDMLTKVLSHQVQTPGNENAV